VGYSNFVQACLTASDQHASGEDDDEFDWRVFRWHRLEQTTRIPNAAKNPWAAEAILDIEATPMSRNASRRPSPRPAQLDASAVSSSSGTVPLEGLPSHGASGTFDASALVPSWNEPGGQDLAIPDLLSYTEGRWSLEDNFLRFMDQAGYTSVNDGSEAFPWMS